MDWIQDPGKGCRQLRMGWGKLIAPLDDGWGSPHRENCSNHHNLEHNHKKGHGFKIFVTK